MNYYAGLDISMKETAVCIVNGEGEIVHESIQVTDPKSIAKCLNRTKLNIVKVGLESGSITRWLTLQLKQLGINAIPVDSRLMNGLLKINFNKTDTNDARGIANAMRANMYSEIYIKSNESLELRVLISSRSTLVAQRSQMMVTIRGHIKATGIRPGPFSSTNAEERLRPHLKGQPAPLCLSVKILLNMIAKLNDEITKLENAIEELINGNEDAELIQTIPGVGPIISAAFLSEIDNPHRFKKSRSVPAYLGMTPRQYASGETQIMGRISKCGNTNLRSLLYQAGMVTLTRTAQWSKLKAWGMKIQRKHGTKKAAMAIARKLAMIMHRMLITRKIFEHGEPKKKKEKVMKRAMTDKHENVTATI